MVPCVERQALARRRDELEAERRVILTRAAVEEFQRKHLAARGPLVAGSSEAELESLLGELNSARLSAVAALDTDDYDLAARSLGELAQLLARLDAAYPNTLLSADLRERYRVLQAELEARRAPEALLARENSRGDVLRFPPPESQGSTSSAGRAFLLQQLTAVFHSVLRREYVRTEDDVEMGLRLVSGRAETVQEILNVLERLAEFVAAFAPPSVRDQFPATFGSVLALELRRTTLLNLLPEDRADLPHYREGLELVRPFELRLRELGYFREDENIAEELLRTYEKRWHTARERQYMTIMRRMLMHSPHPTPSQRRELVAVPPPAEPEPQVQQPQAPAAETQPEDDGWDWSGDDDEGDAEPEGVSEASVSVPAPERASSPPERRPAAATAPTDGAPAAAASPDDPAEPTKGDIVDLYEHCIADLGTPSAELYVQLYTALLPSAYAPDQRIEMYTDAMYMSIHTGSEELREFAAGVLQQHINRRIDEAVHDLLPLALADTGHNGGALLQFLKKTGQEAEEEGGAELRERVLGAVLEATAVQALRTVIARADIPEDESARLAAYVLQLDAVRAPLQDVNLSAPSWHKLQIMGQLLASNLVTIGLMREQHMLVDFSPEELTQLVSALFVDSPRRAALIAEFGRR